MAGKGALSMLDTDATLILYTMLGCLGDEWVMRVLRGLGFNYSERGDDVFEVVKELAQLKGIDVNTLHVPKVVVLSLSVGLTNLLVKELDAKEVPWIYRARPLYVGNVEGTEVGIIWASPGAPLAAMVMEHLVACGAKYIIGIGLVAAIEPEIDVGALVIPVRAIRGEGTSYYYLPEDIDTTPDTDVVEALRKACKELNLNCIEGTVFTTDAIHRETKGLIEALRRRGVVGIDMETSAIFAVGTYRGVKTGCILTVSTNPKVKSIGFYSEKLGKSLSNTIKVLKKAIKYLNE